MIRGSCLCGAVAVEIDGPLPLVSACHCIQCRKQSGHHWASVHIPRNSLRLTKEDGLRWYQSSNNVRRGFCGTCRAFLFWDLADEDKLSVSMGFLEAPTGTILSKHIFVAGKGDYYDLQDGLPQSQ